MKKTVTATTHIALVGSQKNAPTGEKVRDVGSTKRLEISIMLPCKAGDAEIDRVLAEVTSGKRAPLTVAELTQLMGATDDHIGQVKAACAAKGITVLEQSVSDKAHGIVRLSGTFARFRRLFPNLKLSVYKEDGGTHIGREGHINVDRALPILGVYGLDDRNVAHTNYRRPIPGEGKGFLQARRLPAGLTSRGLARLQGVPVEELDKLQGVVTAYISLGGDNGKKMEKDIELAAKHDGIGVSKFFGVSVDGTAIEGDYNDDATVENALDKQGQALLNPNGWVGCFRAANSDDAFARAQETANVFEGVKVGDVVLPLMGVSISWGMAESAWTEQSLKRWERAFKAARLRGIIVTAATGDNGSKDGTEAETADAPSCVPHVIGAAGVYIRSADGTTVSEIGVWNDMARGGGATGGGISTTFPLMAEEKGLNVPVSAANKKPGHSASVIADCAAPDSGPMVYYKGRASQVGGTSHAAPFIVIKLCLMQKLLKTPLADMVGFVYANAKGMFHQVTVAGNNGAYPADPTDLYNAAVGFGVIDWDGFKAVAQKKQGAAA
jgi:kumamolisin